MHILIGTAWSTADYCLEVNSELAPASSAAIADDVYDRVCRFDFNSAGFCLLDLGSTITSQLLRRMMVALKSELNIIHQSRTGRDLVSLSAGRFDQQTTTKFHRDGAPDESFLMLGYEPTQILSEIALADYAKCAYVMGLSPQEFLDRHNPMFAAGEQLLAPYTTRVGCFANDRFQILLINNSMANYSEEGGSWQGVLHTATVRQPSEEQRRVVNSMMVASVPPGTKEPISTAEQLRFVESTVVRRRGYDKPLLSDDV